MFYVSPSNIHTVNFTVHTHRMSMLNADPSKALACEMDEGAWPVGHTAKVPKDKVKRPKGPSTRSQGPEGPLTFSMKYHTCRPTCGATSIYVVSYSCPEKSLLLAPQSGALIISAYRDFLPIPIPTT